MLDFWTSLEYSQTGFAQMHVDKLHVKCKKRVKAPRILAWVTRNMMAPSMKMEKTSSSQMELEVGLEEDIKVQS